VQQVAHVIHVRGHCRAVRPLPQTSAREQSSHQ
jgi:hypothetical protein